MATKYDKKADKLSYIIIKDYYRVKQKVSNKKRIATYLMLEDKGPSSPRGGLYTKQIIKKVKARR